MQGNLLVHVFNENQILTRVILSFLGSLPTWSRFDSIGNDTLMDLERKLGRYLGTVPTYMATSNTSILLMLLLLLCTYCM